ncbi:PTS system fructose-specific IIA component [Kineothrix alysoides]|uniref:PTS system fructose-specific IIA component n=1 Tax=Kineothrix alysoides TaxID=1469948 RepID=A0A4R1R4K2_9FIRM|nr:PTS sugar transporter subunit IIA [Kineothrix alysoides]TCL60348.1 PTS system fructose-specific IIA component [Kineothrix alysoides]
MDIREILSEENIQLNSGIDTKEQALKAMAEMLFRSGKIENADIFLRDVWEREKMGFTGAGNKIAIPHGISGQVKKVAISIVRTQKDILWESEQESIPKEAKLVRFIVLFAVPEKSPKDGEIKYIEALKAVCRKLADRQATEGLLKAHEASQIIEIINYNK